MNDVILLKLGEVVLKGLNRHTFEDKLMSNIRRRLQHCGKFQVYSRQSTIYVEPQPGLRPCGPGLPVRSL